MSVVEIHTGDWATVKGARTLSGIVRTPGDKSISHRALLIAALANGRSVLRGLSDGNDVHCTKAAVAALGASVSEEGEGVIIEGGRDTLHSPSTPLDCGNSGTAMRLLAGMVAGLPISATLVGDASLSSRPMDRIVEPLTAMGATIRGVGERVYAPLVVEGGKLKGIRWHERIGSAQVKSAILFAALGARGVTTVIEETPTRAHSEELLSLAGATVKVFYEGEQRVITLSPSKLKPLTVDVAGDPSQGAFFIVAGLLVTQGEVCVQGLYGGAERVGFLRVLSRMGARLEVVEAHDGALSVTAYPSTLRGTQIHAAEIPSLDEVPILAVAAAKANGTTRFVDVGELRVKESDRLSGVAQLVRALGGEAEIEGDDLIVYGKGRLRHGVVRSNGDHRLAMAGAIGALGAGRGETTILGFACVRTSFPRFIETVSALGGVARRPLIAIDGPAGSGKSTLAHALTQRLGIERLDTGSMYRGVAWKALEQGLDLLTRESVAELAQAVTIAPAPGLVRINGVTLKEELRSAEVNHAVSIVAANPGVRESMVRRQREWARVRGGGVMEGRDIATVVLPHADLKIYLTASPEERARRRREEGADALARRDKLDSSRAASPLMLARGARLVDTTNRVVEEIVEEICAWL